ncbi:MAG TPA: serine hydrolase [Thermoanaerobaculia bacterium]|nr:serine hydrolase [Thermoanaerobaculia bacterium]
MTRSLRFRAFVRLALSVAWLMAPARTLGSATVPPNTDVSARIRRVETGLLPAVTLRGEPRVAWALADRMQHYGIPGVSIAVIDSGKLAWTRGYGVLRAGGTSTVTADTFFEAASISKPITAVAAMRLVEDGRLALDEDVNRWLRRWKVPPSQLTREQQVTLRRLLSHTAGVSGHGFRGYAPGERVPTLLEILQGRAPANTEPLTIEFVPGSKLLYSGGGYLVVQQLLTDVTHRPFDAVAHASVLARSEMRDSTFAQPLPRREWHRAASGHDEKGAAMPGGWNVYPELAPAGLWSSAADVARFAIEMLCATRGESRMLGARWAKEMLEPQQPGGWGLGFELHGKGSAARFGHTGSVLGYRSAFVVYPATGQGAVVMTNSDNGVPLAEEILRSVSAEYGWPDYVPVEKVIVTQPAEVLRDYVGRYRLDDGLVITVTVENGKLMGQPGDRPKLELLPQSTTLFFLREMQADVEFRRDEHGAVTALVLHEGEQEPSVAPRLP